MLKPKSSRIKYVPALFVLLSLAILASCTKNTSTTITTPGNKVPVVTPGPEQWIMLPHDTVTFTGSAADSDGTVVAYLWSEVSGPTAATIVNPGSPSTKVIGFTPGTYVFQLMATDNQGATGVDTTSVVVTLPPATITDTIAPSNNPNEMEITLHNGVDGSVHGAFPDWPVEAWTESGSITNRELFSYDLSSIPANATIISANLYLYSYPAPLTNGNLTDANFGANNALTLSQVTSSWSTATAGWFNQPSVNTNNAISIPTTAQSFLDLNLNVTSMVGSMVNNNANYGFLLQLQSEVEYTSRIFVSSWNATYPDKHPKLVVSYTTP